jgi:hypothetical protein
MKKLFTFFCAALMSVCLFGKTVQDDISIYYENWGWGYNSQVVNDGDLLKTTLTGEWGAVSTGWEPSFDLSGWDKIIILVENMSGCDGEWFKLKAYLRDDTESEANQMEGLLGLDAPDNQQNYLVIDLHQDKACDLTKARILAIQCQPNGAVFKISRVYLEKEVEDEAEYFLAGSMNEWQPDENYQFEANPEAEGEFMLAATLTEGDEFKVIGVLANDTTWYPEGMDNNYVVDAEHAGDVTIYFRPDGQGGEDWYNGFFYVAVPMPQPEKVKVGANFPTENRPEDSNIEIAGTFVDGTHPMEKIEATGWFVSYEFVNAFADNVFKFRDKTNPNLVLCEYIPANGEGEGKYVQAIFTFGDYWSDDSWKGEDCKLIEVDLSNDELYAWVENAPEPDPEVFFLAGSMNGWKADINYQFEANPEAEGEFMLATTLAEGDEIKVIGNNGLSTIWYPAGMGNNYVVDADHAGDVTIYFRPDGQGGEGWYEGFFFVEVAAPQAIDEIVNRKSSNRKFINDGMLLIERDGKTYNVLGTMVR